MKIPTWHLLSNLLIITSISVAIYAGGFLLLRMKFVKLQSRADGHSVFYSESLAMNPNGPANVAISFYKPAFLTEMKFHKGNSMVINGWGSGMRWWQFTLQSDS